MSVLIPAAHWRFFQGHVFGLQQASMVGAIRVDRVDAINLDLLDEVMGRAILKPYACADQAAPIAYQLIDRLLYWVAEAQRQARIPVSHRHWIRPMQPPASEHPDTFELALQVTFRQATVTAFQEIARIINACLGAPSSSPPAEEWAQRLARLTENLKGLAPPGFNHLHITDAAYRLNLPVQTIMGSKLRLGTGSRAHIVDSTVTDETPVIGMTLSQDKWLTARVLGEIGLPVPRHELVTSASQALEMAHKLGYPVVVKPANLDQGKGVAANLRLDANVVSAYEAARKLSSRILVEQHVEGFGHRLTIHRGELIAALKRIPGGVLGDGQHSVAELLARQLLDPEVRRNLNMGRVQLDEEALAMLAEQGMAPDTIPAEGAFIQLRRRDNISAGGRTVPLSPADIHPDNLQLAIRAARAVYLDLAGVDLLIPDIALSWKTSGAIICEVNGRPQFGPGRDGDNYLRVLERLVGPQPRIPVHLYLCSDPQGDRSAARLDQLRTLTGSQAASSRHGVWLDGACCASGFANGYLAARAALSDRDVGSLVMALDLDDILAHGLPIDRVDSVVVSPLDHWPEKHRTLLDETLRLAGVRRRDVRFE
jgi:cyanophycin synthetase